MLGLTFKIVYDIGYFDAQSLENDKNAELPITQPVLTMESAQRIVSGALKEDPTNPKTIVDEIVDNHHKLSTIEPLAKLSTGKRNKLIKAPDKPVFERLAL